MQRFLVALLIATSIFGAFEYGRSQGTVNISFDRPPRYPSVTPVIDECKDSVTYDGYERVPARATKRRKCSNWVYTYDPGVNGAVCMDDLSIVMPR